ncbi:MAG TPA: serine/threonine-protein kinase, partial [Rudaea sp.]
MLGAVAVDTTRSDARAAGPTRLRQLFDRVQNCPHGERETLLKAIEATPGERRVLSALLAQSTRPSILQTPVREWIRTIEDCGISEDDLRGRKVGRYRLEDVIGRGGSAVVFRARDTADAHRVAAVKLIHRSLYTPGARRRIEREVEILKRLRHRAIAALLDSGVSEWGMPYLALEHIEGTNIVAYANLHALSQGRRIAMLMRVCDGLSLAHAQRIVHCDIKPGNVLVTMDGDVKIVDFGIARMLDDDSATVGMTLTPFYAAPEQCEGRRADPR